MENNDDDPQLVSSIDITETVNSLEPSSPEEVEVTEEEVETSPVADEAEATTPSTIPSPIEVPLPLSEPPTPTLSAATLPNPTSQPLTTTAAPAPTKKFASSLSVNKKFLEKAGEKGKPEVRASFSRLATPPLIAPVSTSHPRLLTGKISAGTSVTLTTAHTIPGVSGWNKPTPPSPAVVAQQQQEALKRQQEQYLSAGRSGPSGYQDRGRAGSGSGAVWGARGAGGSSFGSNSGGGLGGIGGDFPTAAEAANAKHLRATALLEQMQSRDRAVQARAAAAAAANAHLLEGLDAFRGVHLDPNASHWDEMGDEDNDFLDDTIEFGDGTQYKIETEVHLPPSNEISRPSDELAEPHPSDFATREAPLAPGEVSAEPTSREERFKDDFDRTWSTKPAATTDSKNLFNDRLGKLEPYAGRKGTPGTILSQPTDSTAPPPSTTTSTSHFGHRRPSVTSPRVEAAQLPSTSRPVWGRDAGRAPEWRESSAAGSAPAPRRASIETKPSTRRMSVEPPARKPSIDQGIRQLPPHLAATPAPVPPRQEPRPSALVAPPPPPPAAPTIPTLTSYALSSNLKPVPAAPEPTADPVPAPVPDLVELHAREMHAAAERARKRRQDEEQVRVEAAERAKKKAAELEERIWREAAAALPTPPVAAVVEKAKEVPVRSGVSAVTTATKDLTQADRVDSWRKPVTAQVPVQHPLPPTPIAPAAVAKPAPTQILAREVTRPLPSSTLPSTFTPAESKPPHPISSSRPLPGTAATKPTQALEERTWRRPDPVPPPTAKPTPTVIIAQSSSVPSLPNGDLSLATPSSGTLHSAPSPVTTDSPVTQNLSPPSGRKGSTSGPAKVVLKKLPQISTLEDVMSRIKGAMSAPPSAVTPKEAEPATEPTLKTESQSATKAEPEPVSTPDVESALASEPIPEPEVVHTSISKAPSKEETQHVVPTVKLPTAFLVSNASALPSAAVPLSENVGLSIGHTGQPSTRGRPIVRKASRPVPGPPTFESREPTEHFDITRFERSVSPPPAWKMYPIRLAFRNLHIPPLPRLIKAFYSSHLPKPAQVFSWEAPVPGLETACRPSREDLFLPKGYKKGFLKTRVKVPSKRITRRTSAEELAALIQASFSAVASLPRDRGVVLAAEAIRDADALANMEDSLNATTAPPAEALFDLGPPRPRVFESRLAAGASRPLVVEPHRIGEVVGEKTADSRAFMVTSELNGELVIVSPREPLAAPGRSQQTPTQELPSLSFEHLDNLSTTQPLSPPALDPWASKTPLTLSVLDPTAPSVWSAPPNESSAHVRSLSLGGAKPENSLHGLSDMDDFPAASIPTSLADLKSEDEGSSEGDKKTEEKPVTNDEAKLRAAAPSFASYQNPRQPPNYDARYLTFTRQPSHPQLHAPSVSPINYGVPPFLPPIQGHAVHPSSSYGPPGSHIYPNFSLPSQSMSPMGVYSYPQAGYAPPHSPSSQAPAYNYRPNPQAITNPALIASAINYNSSYGAIGAGAYGVVGGQGAGGAHGAIGRGGNHGSPMAPSYLQSPYMSAQQLPPYRDAFVMDQQQRVGYNGGQYPTSPSLNPATLYGPPLPAQGQGQGISYNGSFSPQLQNTMAPNGVINGRENQNRFRRGF